MLLILTTARRLAVLLFVFLLWAPAAYAWSWPVQGQVVRPFAYDEAHPYAAGQHRGVDIGAEAVGEAVAAPAAGTVSFAGTVPTNGRTVTIETADGYSVTLTHLGSIAVARGAAIAEQQAVGTVGPSGTPEVDGPYVHLGIRLTADPNGYVDPLGLLPSVPESGATDSGSTGTQPSSSGVASAPPQKKSASSARPSPHVVTGARGRPAASSQEQGRAGEPGVDAHPHRASRRPTAREAHTPLEARTARSRPSPETSSLRRPLEEPSSPAVGPRPVLEAPLSQVRRGSPDSLLGLVCNWAAALIALGAALAAARRRRDSNANAQVLHLPRPAAAHRRLSRAA